MIWNIQHITSYVDFDEGYLSVYLLVIIMFIMCHKKFKMKFKLKYLSNTEDCLYFVKGFLVCSIKDRYRENVTKTKTNDKALKRYFTNVDSPSKRRKILFVVKKVVVDHFNYILHIRTVCLSLDQTVSYYFSGIKVNWVLQRKLDDRFFSYK